MYKVKLRGEILFTIFTGGLSIGAVSGIVIAIIVGLILACLAVYFLCIKTQGKCSILCWDSYFPVRAKRLAS